MDQRRARTEIAELAKEFGRSTVARTAGVSRQHLTAWLSGRTTMSQGQLMKLQKAGAAPRAFKAAAEMVLGKIRELRKWGPIHPMAELADMDPGQFSRIVNGARRVTRATLDKLTKLLAVICDRT